MRAHSITMLGTGLIGDFYTMTLHGQRGRDRIRVAYSRTEGRGSAFSERWGIPEHTTDLQAAVNHPETDVIVIGLPNYCLLYTSPSPRDRTRSRMPSSA